MEASAQRISTSQLRNDACVRKSFVGPHAGTSVLVFQVCMVNLAPDFGFILVPFMHFTDDKGANNNAFYENVSRQHVRRTTTKTDRKRHYPRPRNGPQVQSRLGRERPSDPSRPRVHQVRMSEPRSARQHHSGHRRPHSYKSRIFKLGSRSQGQQNSFKNERTDNHVSSHASGH